MKTDLKSLRIFAQVVESNSSVKTARQLQMPTSTVSRRVGELEKQLGVRLIERSSRNLGLADVGSENTKRQRSAEIRDSVSNILSNHIAKVSGKLSISVPPTVSDSLLNLL